MTGGREEQTLGMAYCLLVTHQLRSLPALFYNGLARMASTEQRGVVENLLDLREQDIRQSAYNDDFHSLPRVTSEHIKNNKSKHQ